MAKKKYVVRLLTVSEIAKEANVSRNKVWSYIRRNDIDPINKENGKFKFDSKIVSEIRKKQKENSKDNENKIVFNDSLEILKKQLEKKDEQLARKDDQLEEKDKQIAKKDEQIQNKDNTINFLQRELIQAGVENEKKQKLLDNARRKEEAISESELKKERMTKKHWWNRLFRGDNDEI